MAEAQQIRALFAPIPGGGAVLLPGSVIAEVMAYTEPDPYLNAPRWLIGELRWGGWKIPLMDMSRLAGGSDFETLSERSRILVVKTLTEASSVLHVGMLITGMPRIKNITPANLVEHRRGEVPGVFSEVSVDDQVAVIPDLEQLAEEIEKAVYTR